MADRTLTPVVEDYTFLEGPRWHDGRLWLSDFYTHKVIAATGEGEVEDIVTVPQQPSGLGWLPDGTTRVATEDLRFPNGSIITPDGRRTLYICVAPGFAESERSTTRLGRVVATTVDVPRAEGARP